MAASKASKKKKSSAASKSKKPSKKAASAKGKKAGAKAATKASKKLSKAKGKAPKPAGKVSSTAGSGKKSAPSDAKKAKSSQGGVAKNVRPQMSSAAEIETALAAAKGQLNAAGQLICREVACESLASTGGYCRLHYIKNWKKVKKKELILKEKKLNRYIEELVAKYPDKYIEAIRNDLSSDKEFSKVVSDLSLDEGGVDEFEVESDSVDQLIHSIKREIDDDDDDELY